MLTSLVGRVLMNSILILFLTALIICAKHLLKNHLSLKAQYYLWLPFIFILIVPFIPIQFSGSNPLFHWISLLKSQGSTISHTALPSTPPADQFAGSSWIQDFSISVSRTFSDTFYMALLVIWVMGIIFFAGITIYSHVKIAELRKASLPLQNKAIRSLYISCRQELNMTKDIPVLTTAFLNSPITVGVVKPCIILPLSVITDLPETKIRYILMHELLHCKHRDPLINLFACFMQMIYWFHPAVWAALRTMRTDCETACDGDVLSRLYRQEYLDYGMTLLDFASKSARPFCSPVSGLGGTAREIKKRILHIKYYQEETRRQKLKSTVVFFLIASLVCGLTPVISSYADLGNQYHISSSNKVPVDFSSYFQGYEGSFVLYNTNTEQFHIYNEAAAATRVSPDSTYKIYSALAALEQGIITPESNTLFWDHTQYPIEAWNQDHTLSLAMKNSANWYFTELDQQSGLDCLQKTLSDIHYGNQNITGGLGRFWLESSLRISPAEQVELLTKLYEGTLPFEPQSMNLVKDSLFLFSSGSSALYGKTGTGTVDGADINGWFIGFLETADDTYIFAANIKGSDSATGSMASQITLDILKDLSLYTE